VTKDLEGQLEILIFTYNRAAYLEWTLAQLLASPFAGCKLTVLDNCSTDETPQVCAQYQGLFAEMRVVRHRKNIGLAPNYLRAVELAEAPYAWILGDDDVFDFSNCTDVIDVVENGDFDLIYLGDLGETNWARGMATTSAHLAKNGSNYFFLLSFVNNFIFKPELFDSACLAEGYRSAANLFPQFEFCKKSVRDDFAFYISKQKIMQRGEENNHLGFLSWLTAWVNNCRTIEDRELRKATVYELPHVGKNRNYTRWLKHIATSVIVGKINAPEKVLRQIGQIVLGLSGTQRLLFSFILPLVLVPSSVYKQLRRMRYRRMYDESQLEVKRSHDAFRS
jgi:glycosyltransferase involved in cell wall biosynthesis